MVVKREANNILTQLMPMEHHNIHNGMLTLRMQSSYTLLDGYQLLPNWTEDPLNTMEVMSTTQGELHHEFFNVFNVFPFNKIFIGYFIC